MIAYQKASLLGGFFVFASAFPKIRTPFRSAALVLAQKTLIYAQSATIA